MGVVWRGCIFVKKDNSQDSTSCLSLNLRGCGLGNLHFNKVPRCLPCILESTELHPFVREKGCWERAREGEKGDRQTAATAVSCILAMLSRLFDETLQYQNGYNFQTATFSFAFWQDV